MLCKYCNEDKPESSFPTAGVVKGKTYFRKKCNSCYIAMKTERKVRIKSDIADFRKTLKCEHCGNKDYRVLEFHHKNDDKEHNVADMLKRGYSLVRVMKEIQKCIPLCANCHRIEHYELRAVAQGKST